MYEYKELGRVTAKQYNEMLEFGIDPIFETIMLAQEGLDEDMIRTAFENWSDSKFDSLYSAGMYLIFLDGSYSTLGEYFDDINNEYIGLIESNRDHVKAIELLLYSDGRFFAEDLVYDREVEHSLFCIKNLHNEANEVNNQS